MDSQQPKTAIQPTLQKIQTFLTSCKNFYLKAKNFFHDKKNDSRVVMALAAIMLLIAAYFLVLVITNLQSLNQKIPQLVNLDSYDTRLLASNPLTSSVPQTMDTITDLIKENTDMKSDISTYSNYLADLQVPYTYFLQYIYLPSLNIWKDPYTHQIDPDLIGM